MTGRETRALIALGMVVSLAACGGGGSGAGTGTAPVVSVPSTGTGTTGGTAPSPPPVAATAYGPPDYSSDFTYQTLLAVTGDYFVAADRPTRLIDVTMATGDSPFAIAFTAGAAERVALTQGGQPQTFSLAERLAEAPVRFYVKGPDTLRLGVTDTNIQLVPRYASIGTAQYGCVAATRDGIAGERCRAPIFVFGQASPVLAYGTTGIDYAGRMMMMGGTAGGPDARLEGSALIGLHPHPAVNTIDGVVGFNERNADNSLGPRITLLFKLPFDRTATSFTGTIADQQGRVAGTVAFTLFGPNREEVGYAFRASDTAAGRVYAGIGVASRQ